MALVTPLRTLDSAMPHSYIMHAVPEFMEERLNLLVRKQRWLSLCWLAERDKES